MHFIPNPILDSHFMLMLGAMPEDSEMTMTQHAKTGFAQQGLPQEVLGQEGLALNLASLDCSY